MVGILEVEPRALDSAHTAVVLKRKSEHVDQAVTTVGARPDIIPRDDPMVTVVHLNTCPGGNEIIVRNGKVSAVFDH